jgi:1-acyl-sn-glycerol-3-phosphate acyltransferase
MADDVPLTRMEKLALAYGEWSNNAPRGKWLQDNWLRRISYVWVRAAIANRIFVEGLEDLMTLRPETGVMVVSNHRSFFDQYCMMLACFMGPVPFARRLYFPVRSNFFYDHPLGVFVNAGVAGGAMYPPIYRQAERRALNDEALDKMVEILQTPGNILGMHPEGTRGKGDDPYTSCRPNPVSASSRSSASQR